MTRLYLDLPWLKQADSSVLEEPHLPSWLQEHHVESSDLTWPPQWNLNQMNKTTRYEKKNRLRPNVWPGYLSPELRENLDTWLHNLGLQFNPFEAKFWEAGADPQLSAYLVGHDAFVRIWRNQPSFMFAAPGGGKTAFRVRLTRACRVGEDKRRILAVVYKMRGPAEFKPTPTLTRHQEFLNQVMAQELLLVLAYQPGRYLDLKTEAQLKICQQLEANLPGRLEYYLGQLNEAGNLSPLIEGFDLTAARLPRLPSSDRLRLFCNSLLKVLTDNQPHTRQDEPEPVRFQNLVELAQQTLGYEAIYVLIDGVDAYPEVVQDPREGLALLRPLLQQTPIWANEKIYTKYFLPQEFEDLIRDEFKDALTSLENFVTIDWTSETLKEVLQERLRVASDSAFTSLDAISSPGLRDAEAELVETVQPLPREVLALAWWLFVEHVRQVGPKGKLEPSDLDAAIKSYKKFQPLSASP